MDWVWDHTVRQFISECSDDWELHIMVDSWFRCHGGCQLTGVPGLKPGPAVDYYEDELCLYCRANWEMANFVYRLTN